MSKLVIVESPAKAKTIEKHLGPGYQVVASMGHIRDLPKTLLGVDIENNFKPRYVDIAGKTALIRQLKAAASESDGVLLATDPDREGEAISWHLAQVLKIDINEKNRITFNEITKSGVKQGMSNPRSIDMNLVNAQQARRILDRIVGYKLSPFLWKKIRKGLSAGRVQSVAVRIIVDREEEIRAFVSEEYWTIESLLSATQKGRTFKARLHGLASDRKKMKIENKETADRILEHLNSSEFKVESVKRGKREISPAAPFITSTLQQEASRKLGFNARRTMKAAQELYEGVEVEGYGAVGLITYMRTDSLRISEEARREGSEYIQNRWGKEYILEKPRVFKSRGSSQDAHEAIRPTMPSLSPDKVRDSLTSDQYRLYKLIWERFIASLMANCIHDTIKMDIIAGDYLFRASGYTVRFDGHTVLYVEGKDQESESDGPLPSLDENTTLFLREIKGNQHFTQPPPRYTEASLIKALEENGIGRPSTYAPTITTILSREYVEREDKVLKPTALGEITTKVMKELFPEIVDVEFTANMEHKLDAVDSGKINWVDTLDEFYKEFSVTLENAEKTSGDERIVIPDEITDIDCELCGRKMVVKSGRYGKFLACPGYPECKNTKKLVIETGSICPKCDGNIIVKKSKRNRTFYGCSNYPDCDFVSWNPPAKDLCPNCGKPLFKKKGKAGGIYCITEGCGYTAEDKKN
jgi:DNA topoisomerase-1